MTAGAATIVIARDDLSISGAPDDQQEGKRRPADIERAFFELVHKSHPNVIVLDCRDPECNGMRAIQTIRNRIDTPILVVCADGDRRERDYRIAGAADCLVGPFDILRFNEAIQHIIRVTRPAAPRMLRQMETYDVAGLVFNPQDSELAPAFGSDGDAMSVKLTTAENRLLLHLLHRPWRVCSRVEIAEILYGAHRPTSDRAIDVVVTRLRKKLAQLRGPNAGNVIRTEFREGYMFVGDVAHRPAPQAKMADAVY